MSIVKISFESTTKRVKLSVSSFAELKETVAKLFPQLSGSNEFFIQYSDEVGDIVTVSDDDDVSLMVSDPNLAKTKIIVSRVLMTNSEVSKQMKESVAIPSQMEPVRQESTASSKNETKPQAQTTPEIGVYPTLAKETESAKAEPEKVEVEMTKVEETPSSEKPSRQGKRGGSRPRKELSEKQRKLIKLARKIVGNKDVAAKKKEKFLNLLSNCIPNVLNSRPGKRLLILKAKAALDTILTESELDEIKQLQQNKKLKKALNKKEKEKKEKKSLNSQYQNDSDVHMASSLMEKVRANSKGDQERKSLEAKADKKLAQLLPGLIQSLRAHINHRIDNHQETDKEAAIHLGIQCDGCQMKPIVGVRHSNRAQNYDLCSICVKKVNYAHPLEKIDAPLKVALPKSLQNNQNKKEEKEEVVVEMKAPSNESKKEELDKKADNSNSAPKNNCFPHETKLIDCMYPCPPQENSKDKENNNNNKDVKNKPSSGSNANDSFPNWVEIKAKDLVEVFGSDPLKTHAFVFDNRWLSQEDLMEELLKDESKLKQIL